MPIAVLVGGILAGGLFIGKLRFALPPLVTGLVVTMIRLALVKVGIQYAAGGVPTIGTEEYGSAQNWFAAGVVISVTLGLKFFTRGMLSVSAVLLDLLVGYVVVRAMGMVASARSAMRQASRCQTRCTSGSSSRWPKWRASA